MKKRDFKRKIISAELAQGGHDRRVEPHEIVVAEQVHHLEKNDGDDGSRCNADKEGRGWEAAVCEPSLPEPLSAECIGSPFAVESKGATGDTDRNVFARPSKINATCCR